MSSAMQSALYRPHRAAQLDWVRYMTRIGPVEPAPASQPSAAPGRPLSCCYKELCTARTGGCHRRPAWVPACTRSQYHHIHTTQSVHLATWLAYSLTHCYLRFFPRVSSTSPPRVLLWLRATPSLVLSSLLHRYDTAHYCRPCTALHCTARPPSCQLPIQSLIRRSEQQHYWSDARHT